MIQMKRMAAAVACAAASVGAQALTTGDIAFTGVASNNSGVSQFSLVTFADLAAGTVIFITDTNYKQNGPSSNFGFVGSTVASGLVSGTPESYIALTVGPGGLSAGTDLGFTFNSNTQVGTTTAGTVAVTGTANTSGFSGSADSLWAYVAGSSFNLVGTPLTGLTTFASGSGDNLPATITAFGLSTGSTETSLNGVNAVTAVKYAFYNGPTTFDTWTDAKLAVADTSKWSVSGSASSAALPIAELFITAVPEPSTYAMLLAGLGMIGVIARRRSV